MLADHARSSRNSDHALAAGPGRPAPGNADHSGQALGPCIAGGVYLRALSDIVIMVEGTSFMGLGGPNSVKGGAGQIVDAESLGGARMHTASSGVAHCMAKDGGACLDLIRQRFRSMPSQVTSPQGTPPAQSAEGFYDLMPGDHWHRYHVEAIVDDYQCWLDARFAAARGHMDAIIDTLETRRVLSFPLDGATCRQHREHLILETQIGPQ